MISSFWHDVRSSYCVILCFLTFLTVANAVIPTPHTLKDRLEKPIDLNSLELVKERYDEAEHKSTTNIVIAVCVTVGLVLLMVVIGIILCIIFRKKISAIIFAAECDQPQNAPGSVYYAPQQFNHRGALKIHKQAPADLKTQFPDEKDNNPQNAHFQFTEDQNEVFDIGSEVEQVVD